MITISRFKELFFDRKEVIKRANAMRRRALSRLGASVRGIAQRSMRRVPKWAPPAPPGDPPRSREGQLRDFIFFAYEAHSESVIVGPAALTARPVVPALHEYGGTVRIGRKTRRYPPRPYMRPALQRAMEKNRELWKLI